MRILISPTTHRLHGSLLVYFNERLLVCAERRLQIMEARNG